MKKAFFRLFGPGKLRPDYADAADLLRVACMLFVAWYHIWQQSWLNPALNFGYLSVNLRDQVATGYLGVELLLTLSAFLLYLPYSAGKTPAIGAFYKKRAARILPSYWFCLLVMLFAFALPQHLYADLGALLRDLAAHFTFTHNLFRETYFATPLNGALWTLAVEVQFYLIAPFVCRAFRKAPAVVYGCMLLIAHLYRHFCVLPLEDTTYVLNRLPNLMEVYANGMLAAHVYGLLSRRKQPWWDALLSTLLAVGALFLLWRLTEEQGRLSSFETIRQGQMERRFLFSALGGAFLVFGSRSIHLFRALCSNRIVRFLSGISLNFYIWHQVLAVKLKLWRIPSYVSDLPNQAGEQPWQTQYTLVCFLAALIAGVLVTYLVERPSARRLLRDRRKKPLS